MVGAAESIVLLSVLLVSAAISALEVLVAADFVGSVVVVVDVVVVAVAAAVGACFSMIEDVVCCVAGAFGFGSTVVAIGSSVFFAFAEIVSDKLSVNIFAK